MQAVLKMPDDSVTEAQPKKFECWIKGNVQRDDGVCLNIVTDLPAKTSMVRKDPYTFLDYLSLFLKVVIQVCPTLILLANVVWRRGDDQAYSAGRDLSEQLAAVSLE